MGSLYKRAHSKHWWIAYTVGGRQHCESTHTNSKRLALKMLALRVAEVFEGRLRLPKSHPPKFDEWAESFLNSVVHSNTKRCYRSCVNILLREFRGLRLNEISANRICEFQQARLAVGTRAATVNRNCAVLRRMLKIAERRRVIAVSPFCEVEFLEERRQRRQPHILTFEEEARLLAVAQPHVRALAVLILETGLRSGREALALRWVDVDFANGVVHVRESKTLAGRRAVPLSALCRSELMRWRAIVGPEFSPYVFPNPRRPDRPLKDIRCSWKLALKAAGLPDLWIYDLRHTFASRLSAAGAADLFVAQMMGHSTPSILQTYAKVIDEYRRAAIDKLEAFRSSNVGQCSAPRESHPEIAARPQ